MTYITDPKNLIFCVFSVFDINFLTLDSKFYYGEPNCNPYHDYSGTIDFEEFCHLWNYITQWVELFKSLDRDRSGLLERVELQQACYLKRFKN